jgi:GNAT superfamily N-acetyltransferase
VSTLAFTSPVPLGPDHGTGEFDCGSEAQSEWLRRYALQAQGVGTSRVYVTSLAEPNRVVGYYALAAGAVEPEAGSERLRKGVGRYPIPVVILTRLGVDQTVQGHGLGSSLVIDALERVVQAADVIGVRALLIHCESEAARRFYMHLARFEESPTDRLHLTLLMGDLRAALRALGAP